MIRLMLKILCVVVVVLLLNVHDKLLMSGLLVNLTTLFLGRLIPPKQLTSTKY